MTVRRLAPFAAFAATLALCNAQDPKVVAYPERDILSPFRKEDADLYEAFNKELKAFIGTPEHIALVEPFGFGKDYLPNKTMEQLCKGE